MYVAWLWLDRKYRIYPPVNIEEPIEYIRLKANHPIEDERVMIDSQPSASYDFSYSDAATSFDTTGSYATIRARQRYPHVIFKKWRQVGNELWYILDGLSDFPKRTFKAEMPRIIEVGFVEPDENVNFKKLKRKLRRKKKMKELLLKFFRS